MFQYVRQSKMMHLHDYVDSDRHAIEVRSHIIQPVLMLQCRYIFNSSTKCACNPGIIHDRKLVNHPVSWTLFDAWMLSRLNVALIRKLRGSTLMCLVYFWHVIHDIHTSVQLVQELNVCTVVDISFYSNTWQVCAFSFQNYTNNEQIE